MGFLSFCLFVVLSFLSYFLAVARARARAAKKVSNEFKVEANFYQLQRFINFGGSATLVKLMISLDFSHSTGVSHQRGTSVWRKEQLRYG